MSQVYIPEGTIQHRGGAVGSSLWFELPDEAQVGVRRVIAQLENADCQYTMRAASNIIYHDFEVDKYSPNIFICVDGRQYTLYGLCGIFRIGADGESCTRREACPEDQQAIIDYFIGEA